jgi:hypothetical protein
MEGGSSSSGGSAVSPTVYPVNTLATEQAGIAADQYGYNLSDADFASRFPGLVASRGTDMATAEKEMTGPLAAPVENAFTSSGLSKAFSAFGGGSEDPNVTGTGSIGRKTIGASVANDTMSYQNAARDYFQNLIEQNPQRAFGLSGGDLLNLSILNQGNLAQANQQAAGIASQVGAAQAQASQSQTNSLIGAGSSIAGAAIAAL